MSTEANKADVVEEIAKTEEVAAPSEPVVETTITAEPAKIEEEAKEATPAATTETEAPAEAAVKAEETPKEAEKAAESDPKERNGPLKVLATIKRNLASPKKGDKKEEVDSDKEDQTSSPKEKVLDKLVGIFKKDECHCKCKAATEEKAVKADSEAAAAVPVVEEPAAITEEAVKPAEEEKKEDKSKTTQFYGQIVKALTPRKASWKEANDSSDEKEKPKADTTATEAAADETPAAEAEASEVAKKEGEAEPTSPGMLTAIKKRASVLVHALEEKVHKDKESKVKDEVKSEAKAEEVTAEQPAEEVAAADAAATPVEEPVAETETPVEPELTKKETKKEAIGHFIDGVKAKIQEKLSKDQETKEPAVAKEEEPAAVAATTEASTEAPKAQEESPVSGADKKKETFPVNELDYENKKKEKVADVEAPTQEQTSQKWKNRVSGLFKGKKSTTTEEKAEAAAPALASTSAPAPAAEEIAAVTPNETTETTETLPAATTEGDANDGAIRLAQLYMQTPAAQEPVKQEETKAEETVNAAVVEAAALTVSDTPAAKA